MWLLKDFKIDTDSIENIVEKGEIAHLSNFTFKWLLKDFKIDSDSIENIVEKGEIAHLSNFTFFHNVFLKLFYSVCINEYIWRKGSKGFHLCKGGSLRYLVKTYF